MKKRIRLSQRDKAELKRFLRENISASNKEFTLIMDIFVDCFEYSEVWLTHSGELLNMELNSLKQRKMSLDVAIPQSKFRIYKREVETNTWQSLITGIGGYEIDAKKYSLVKIDIFNNSRKKS